MTTSRVSTSARAISTRAAAQAAGDLVRDGNRAIAGPAPLPAAASRGGFIRRFWPYAVDPGRGVA
jgi:hypothetical protein